MSTVTSTLTSTAPTESTILPLRASLLSPSPFSTTTTSLRSLYTRAARAFLLRDVPLTHSLLASAFAVLQPPLSVAPDSLTPHRRKWDILRITLETTIYASPPLAKDLELLPAPLRANLVLSPQTLLASLYTRSLALFTPSSHNLQKPNAAFLPPKILVTLVLASLKLDCASVGRGMVEDWLRQRGHYDEVDKDEEGYEKVLEMYCLNLLPRLEQWEYAKGFLQCEEELPPQRRERLRSSLDTLHSQALSSRRPSSPAQTPPHTSPSTPRAHSPTPSTSSSSSSLSTTSTRTAIPRTPRPNALSPASQSTTSLSSNGTITHRTDTIKSQGTVGNGHVVTQNHWPSSRDRDLITISRPHAITDSRHPSPSMYALIKASLEPYLTASNFTTFVVLFIVFPLLSFLLRVRRRRMLARVEAGASGTAVDHVRRRLGASGLGRSENVLGRLWREVIGSLTDTIRMGGRGLV